MEAIIIGVTGPLVLLALAVQIVFGGTRDEYETGEDGGFEW